MATKDENQTAAPESVAPGMPDIYGQAGIVPKKPAGPDQTNTPQEGSSPTGVEYTPYQAPEDNSNKKPEDSKNPPTLDHGGVKQIVNNSDGSQSIVYNDGTTGRNEAPAPMTTPSGQNALTLMKATLASYGIDSANGSVSNAIYGLLSKNYDASTIQALIESPDAAKNADPSVVALANAWNTRFSGNAARIKAGLTALDPKTYIDTENQYKAVMQRAGLPATAMDPAYIGKLIGADVSPLETSQRINAAMAAVTSEDPYVKQELAQMGLGTGDMVFHLLDPNTAASVIQQKVTAAQIGGEAARQGTNASQSYAMQLAAQGVTQAQAAQGFNAFATALPAEQELASRFSAYGPAGTVGQSLQNQIFGTTQNGETPAQAAERMKRLQAQEENLFGGSAGASTQGQSLGIGTAQGVS